MTFDAVAAERISPFPVRPSNDARRAIDPALLVEFNGHLDRQPCWWRAADPLASRPSVDGPVDKDADQTDVDVDSDDVAPASVGAESSHDESGPPTACDDKWEVSRAQCVAALVEINGMAPFDKPSVHLQAITVAVCKSLGLESRRTRDSVQAVLRIVASSSGGRNVLELQSGRLIELANVVAKLPRRWKHDKISGHVLELLAKRSIKSDDSGRVGKLVVDLALQWQ